MPEKLYEVLGVSEDASQADIEKAYRRKVKETHPDLSDEPDADEKFQLVVRAKEVLTDEEERELYDDLGHKLYMDMFDEDEGSSSSSDSGPSGSEASASSSSRSTSSSDSGSASASSGQAGSTSSSAGSSRRTRATGAASVDSSSTPPGESSSDESPSSGTSSGGASESGTSASETSSGGGSSSGSSSSSSSSSSGSSGGSSGTSEESSGGSGSSDRSTRGATGGVNERTVAQEAERTRKKWQAAARSGETTGGPWSTSSSQGDHMSAERVQGGIATKIRSQDVVEMTVVMLVAYPVFVFATVWPTFPTVVNAFIGLVTVGMLVYTLTEPLVSLVVFGTWSVLTPLLLVFLGVGMLTPGGLFALTVTWVPFLLAFLLTLAMPDA